MSTKKNLPPGDPYAGLGTVSVLPIPPKYREFVLATLDDWRVRLGPKLADLLGRVAFEMHPLTDAEWAALTPDEQDTFKAERRRMREHEPAIW